MKRALLCLVMVLPPMVHAKAACMDSAIDERQDQLATGVEPQRRIPTGPPIWIGDVMRSNGGWSLLFRSDQPLCTVEARLAGHAIWTRASRSFYGVEFGVSFADLPEQAQIEVRAVTARGSSLGPYTFPLDAMAALREQEMRTLRTIPRGWVTIIWHDEGGPFWVMFGTLVSLRCGLREVRYSIDSEAPDQRFELPPCSFNDPFSIPNDNKDYLTLRERPQYVAVQLVYVDGTVSDVVVARKENR